MTFLVFMVDNVHGKKLYRFFKQYNLLLSLHIYLTLTARNGLTFQTLVYLLMRKLNMDVTFILKIVVVKFNSSNFLICGFFFIWKKQRRTLSIALLKNPFGKFNVRIYKWT